MSNTQSLDLISDLTYILEQTYSTLGTQFSFANNHMSLYEVFSSPGFLSVFLYDKQNLIDKFCKEEIDPSVFANINFNWLDSSQGQGTLLCVYLTASHNITHAQDYKKLLTFITTLMVTDDHLNPLTPEFQLDHYYKDFFDTVNSKDYRQQL